MPLFHPTQLVKFSFPTPRTTSHRSFPDRLPIQDSLHPTFVQELMRISGLKLWCEIYYLVNHIENWVVALRSSMTIVRCLLYLFSLFLFFLGGRLQFQKFALGNFLTDIEQCTVCFQYFHSHYICSLQLQHSQFGGRTTWTPNAPHCIQTYNMKRELSTVNPVCPYPRTFLPNERLTFISGGCHGCVHECLLNV